MLTEVLRVFPQFLQTDAGMYLKSGQDGFLPRPIQFIIHYHPLIRRYIIWPKESVVTQVYIQY
jgi:hypothetical protein